MRGCFVGSEDVIWMLPRESGCSRQTRREARVLPSGGALKKPI